MRSIEAAHKEAKRIYDQGGSPLANICEVACIAIDKLTQLPTEVYSGIVGKEYCVFVGVNFRSRPIRSSMMILDC